MAKKSGNDAKKITNKRARFDYDLGSEIVAGISLNGRETKALRLGHGHIKGAHVQIKDGEAWLINATITSANGFKIVDQEQTQTRKLLIKKREIDQLIEAKKQGRTIVPLEILTKGRFIKVKIAVGKGRKKYDKRADIKKKDQERDTQRALRNRL